MHEIVRLEQKVINQIAAGEVVERPASVVKELIENSIDAGASRIDVLIVDGGMTKIEIKDDGKGISREDLSVALERYATSKLTTAEELESIATYGFRGEALAAISAVSKTTIISKRNDEVNSITSDFGDLSKIIPGSRSQGTTITIEELFARIPARQKFLKASDTEYKYIIKIFAAFALFNGKIHFTLTNNGKEIYNFPSTDTSILPRERVAKIYSVTLEDILPVSHEEYGIKTVGFILHPKSLSNKSKFLLSFINNRPVEDKGIYRAVQQGISEFVPDFFKPSAILSIHISPDQVDVNVHPRKTEVKLMNPFRVYSAVTHAIKQSLQTNVSTPDREIGREPVKPYFSTSQNSKWESRQENAYSRLRGTQPQFFFDGNKEESTERPVYPQGFGLTDMPSSENEPVLESRIPEFIISQARQSLADADITPILGRYIIVGFMDEVWVVDQHAAAERVRYEQFKKAFLDGVKLSQQQLLVPIEIKLTEEEKLVLNKNLNVLIRLGFESTISESKLFISAIPTYLQKADQEKLIRDTISEFVEHDDLFLSPIIEDFSTEKNLSLIIATMACHNSVRMNERLSIPEAKSIISDLLNCNIPYACPHGRRVVWRLSKEEIDREFMRT